jgi:hypothetical protein
MLTDEQIDAILHAARALRPETSWNLRGHALEQADDNTPRVSVPTQEEIASYLANQEHT